MSRRQPTNNMTMDQIQHHGRTLLPHPGELGVAEPWSMPGVKGTWVVPYQSIESKEAGHIYSRIPQGTVLLVVAWSEDREREPMVLCIVPGVGLHWLYGIDVEAPE